MLLKIVLSMETGFSRKKREDMTVLCALSGSMQALSASR